MPEQTCFAHSKRDIASPSQGGNSSHNSGLSYLRSLSRRFTDDVPWSSHAEDRGRSWKLRVIMCTTIIIMVIHPLVVDLFNSLGCRRHDSCIIKHLMSRLVINRDVQHAGLLVETSRLSANRAPLTPVTKFSIRSVSRPPTRSRLEGSLKLKRRAVHDIPAAKNHESGKDGPVLVILLSYLVARCIGRDGVQYRRSRLLLASTVVACSSQ